MQIIFAKILKLYCIFSMLHGVDSLLLQGKKLNKYQEDWQTRFCLWQLTAGGTKGSAGNRNTSSIFL